MARPDGTRAAIDDSIAPAAPPAIGEAAALAGVPLPEVAQRLPPRWAQAALLRVAGRSLPEIAARVGYSHATCVLRVLRRPEVASLVDEIRRGQLDDLIRRSAAGDVAGALATRVAAHVEELVRTQLLRFVGAEVPSETAADDARPRRPDSREAPP